MNHYELTCLISPDLSQEEINSLQEEIINFLQEKKGFLIKTERPIKKNLGYSLKKRNQAFLMIIEFQINPQEINDLEKKLKQNQHLLRYILIKKKVLKKAKIIKQPRFPKKIEKKSKVELQEIEEKLKEILGE